MISKILESDLLTLYLKYNIFQKIEDSPLLEESHEKSFCINYSQYSVM